MLALRLQVTVGSNDDIGKCSDKRGILRVPVDRGDLRDEAGCSGGAGEDARLHGGRNNALLGTRLITGDQCDDRHAGLNGQVIEFGDLFAVDLAHGAVEKRGVLSISADLAPIDGAETSDDAVGVGAVVLAAEVGGAVACQRVSLHEGAGVKERFDGAAGSGNLSLRRAGLGELGAQVLDLASGRLQVSHETLV